MFEVIDGMPEGIIVLRGAGRVSADDYRAVLASAIERAALAGHKVRLYLELGVGFEGYDAGPSSPPRGSAWATSVRSSASLS